MTVLYSTLIAIRVAEAIRSTGAKITITRNDVKIAATVGTITNKQKDANDQLTSNQLVILIPAPQKNGVAPGDYIVSDSRTYFVKTVEEVKPAGTVILYKASIV